MGNENKNVVRSFNSLIFFFAAAVYCYMLAYVIIVMPKTLMSISMGITQFLMVLICLISFFMFIPFVERKTETMPIREKPMSEQWFAIALHISVGIMIISDPLFLKEKNPKAGAPQVSIALYEMMIAGAASQAGAILASVLAQATFTDG